MKATIDLPDDLYRQVKAKSALEGRAVREVTIELYRRWLEERETARPAVRAEEWLRSWLDMADRYMNDAPAGATAREVLEQDRNRLAPR